MQELKIEEDIKPPPAESLRTTAKSQQKELMTAASKSKQKESKSAAIKPMVAQKLALLGVQTIYTQKPIAAPSKPVQKLTLSGNRNQKPVAAPTKPAQKLSISHVSVVHGQTPIAPPTKSAQVPALSTIQSTETKHKVAIAKPPVVQKLTLSVIQSVQTKPVPPETNSTPKTPSRPKVNRNRPPIPLYINTYDPIILLVSDNTDFVDIHRGLLTNGSAYFAEFFTGG